MYADNITDSMAQAIDETNRRRAIQIAYNDEHGIDPQPLRKRIDDITSMISAEDADTDELLARRPGRGAGRRAASAAQVAAAEVDLRRPDGDLPEAELEALIAELSTAMHTAAEELKFELAARYRDEISDLKKELRGMREATK